MNKPVKLKRVKTSEPVTKASFLVRQSQKIKTKDGEEIPFTVPVDAEATARYKHVFQSLDSHEPDIVTDVADIV